MIVHGRDRPEALARLHRALGELIIDGVENTGRSSMPCSPSLTSRMASTRSTGWKNGWPPSSIERGEIRRGAAVARPPFCMMDDRLTPDLLLRAYALGIFPMAKAATRTRCIG